MVIQGCTKVVKTRSRRTGAVLSEPWLWSLANERRMWRLVGSGSAFGCPDSPVGALATVRNCTKPPKKRHHGHVRAAIAGRQAGSSRGNWTADYVRQYVHTSNRNSDFQLQAGFQSAGSELAVHLTTMRLQMPADRTSSAGSRSTDALLFVFTASRTEKSLCF